jgi:YidC/Oxa1 family membrane protein insertase
MGQQFYVIRNNPAPGTPAFKAKEDRVRAKAARKGLTIDAQASQDSSSAETAVEERPAPRVQPKRQTKAQRQAKKKQQGR